MKYSNSYFLDLENSWSSIPDNETFNKKSILITGATGLIGSSITDLLLRRNSVHNSNITIILAGRSQKRICKRFNCYKEGIDYSFMQYDSTVSNEYNINVDYIIHAASNADPISYSKKPVDIILANIIGLQTLLNAASHNNGTRVLYISSSEVYGENVIAPYKENQYGQIDILNPRSCYPSSKRCAETLCAAYKAQYNVDSVIVRPGHIYGPMFTMTDSKASAQFARCAFAGNNIVMKSTGIQKRSYCYALDCASAILTVLLKGVSGEAYNISNSDSFATISDLAHTFANAVGKKVIYENPSEIEKTGYNKMTDSSLDARKLERLGWKGIFSLQTGVKKTLENME